MRSLGLLEATLALPLTCIGHASCPSHFHSQADGDQVIYELYYRPEEAKFSQTSKAGHLEERIAKLEKALGAESLAPVGKGIYAHHAWFFCIVPNFPC